MIVLGLILVIIAAVAVLFAVIATGTLTASPLSAVGITVSVTPLTMFIAGAVALLLVVLGLALIGRGTKRSVTPGESCVTCARSRPTSRPPAPAARRGRTPVTRDAVTPTGARRAAAPASAR